MRGQTAVEYLIVFSTMLGLLIFIAIVQISNPTTEAANDTLYLSQAKYVVDTIGGAIDAVYAEGPGAVNGVSFSISTSWTLELDNENNKVRITVDTSGKDDNAEDNLRYNIDNYHSASLDAGTYILAAIWSENNDFLENLDTSLSTDNKIYIYINPQRWAT